VDIAKVIVTKRLKELSIDNLDKLKDCFLGEVLMGHRAHRGWNQRGEEKTSKYLIIFYLRKRKSLVIIVAAGWRPPCS